MMATRCAALGWLPIDGAHWHLCGIGIGIEIEIDIKVEHENEVIRSLGAETTLSISEWVCVCVYVYGTRYDRIGIICVQIFHDMPTDIIVL